MLRWFAPQLALAVLTAAATGCRPPGELMEEADLANKLAALVEAAVGDGGVVRGAALVVDAPGLGLSWQGGAGFADPDAGRPMTAATPVRIASNTKTYVAAAVLRLVEQGRLDLDHPVGRWLPAGMVGLLAGGGYDTDRMLIRHLLSNTSGLFDHTDLPEYPERILAAPTYRWTPEEQVALAVERGTPWGAPGEVFSYSDTGYVLLGTILEQTTGQPLSGAVRNLVGFERLGLTSTWWELMEPAPVAAPGRARQYLGDVDTFAFEPYYDLYGGGGLVASAADLAGFTRALVSGGVFDKSATLEAMLAPVAGARARPGAVAGGLEPGNYRLGLWRVEIKGLEGWRHTGFWGTSATWVPELDLVVVLTVNQHQAREVLDGVVRDVVLLVRQAHPQG